MNKYKKLFSNIGIFALTNISTKILSILIVPLYTYVLSTGEYGTLDGISSVISLLMPLVTLTTFEGVLRFVMDKKEDNNKVMASAFVITLFGFVILFLLYPMLKYFDLFSNYLLIIYSLTALQAFQQIICCYAKGIDKIKEIGFSSIFQSIILLSLNVIFVLKLKWGINGYLLSIALSTIVPTIYLCVKINFFTMLLSFKSSLDTVFIKKMISYCLPLMPNSLMWWAMSFADRYVIILYCGVAANGIYAVANKIPSIINMIHSIFFQGWQLSAIEEAESFDKNNYYTKIFNAYSVILFSMTLMLLLVIRPLLSTILSNEYEMVWKYTPLLIISVIFSSFSSFYGSNYVAMKKTSGAFSSSVLGATINIVLNFLLINVWGLNGAALATLAGYLCMWIYRIYDTKKFVQISIHWPNFLLNFLIIILQITILFTITNNTYLYYLFALTLIGLGINIFYAKKYLFKKERY